MAARRPGLTQSQETNLVAICSIGRVGLERIADRLEASTILISRSKIKELIIGEVGTEYGPELARFLFGIAVSFRSDSLAPLATLDRISDMVEQAPNSADRFPGWMDCRPVLVRLLASSSLQVATKALEVSYDFERLYQTGRFLTSVRPIFDKERDRILGATVVQTLRLEIISSSGEESTLSIALDRADIEQLKKSCDEALKKGKVIFDQVSLTWNLPTVMPGED
jgi:hypothetical protein